MRQMQQRAQAMEADLMKNQFKAMNNAALEQEAAVKRLKMEQNEQYKAMLIQQKEMDRRIKEAGGAVGGEFGYRNKRAQFLVETERNM